MEKKKIEITLIIDKVNRPAMPSRSPATWPYDQMIRRFAQII